jgi:hypothetical protein
MKDTPRTDAFLDNEVNSINNDYLSFMRQLERELSAANKRADAAIRRLQYMHKTHSDSVQWYQNSIAQALRSLDALPDKLEF